MLLSLEVINYHTYHSFATKSVTQLKIWHFWVTGIVSNVCRCTFNRYSVITQFAKLAAGEQLCRRCTHRKWQHFKTFKNHTFWVVTVLSQMSDMLTIVAMDFGKMKGALGKNIFYFARPHSCATFTVSYEPSCFMMICSTNRQCERLAQKFRNHLHRGFRQCVIYLFIVCQDILQLIGQ